MAVTVSHPIIEQSMRTVRATGTVIPFQSVDVTARVTGKIIRNIKVSSGDWVEQGDELAVLDSDLAERDLTRAQAALASASSTFETAKVSLQRGEDLFSRKAESAEALDALRKEFQTTKAALDQASADVETARINLAMYLVSSPVAGKILVSPLYAGQLSPTTSMFTIAGDGILEISAKVPEKYLPEIIIGASADIQTIGGLSEKATVRKIEPVIDTTTHLATVILRLAGGTKILSGMFVNVAIASGTEKALAVPVKSITYKNGKAIVFVTGKDGLAHERSINILATKDNKASITGDVTVDDNIVNTGAGFLNDGNRVNVIDEEAGAVK